MSLANAGKDLKRVIPERIKVTENFYLDELVDPYSYLNDHDNGLSRLDMDAVNCLQLFRDLYGKPLKVNTWWKLFISLYMEGIETPNIIYKIENSDSVRKFSGFRPKHCPIGAAKSAHKLGKAFDIKGDSGKYEAIIKENVKAFLAMGLKRIENPKITRGWLHIDTEERNHKKGAIRVINLSSHAYDIT